MIPIDVVLVANSAQKLQYTLNMFKEELRKMNMKQIKRLIILRKKEKCYTQYNEKEDTERISDTYQVLGNKNSENGESENQAIA